MPFAKKAAAKKAAAKAGSKGGNNFFERLTLTKTTKASPKKVTSSTLKNLQKKVSKYNDTYEAGLVFVGMSFKGEGGDDVFNAIKDTCRSIKLNARRVDENY